MRVLVTGGAGFIGSNLVFALVGAGHEVSVVDDFSTGKVENLHPAVRLYHMSILDPAMPDAFAEFAPECVVHLAAQTDVGRSIEDPELDRRVNVEGTAAVARAAAACGARRMLSASSAAVYGPQSVVPTPETASKAPMNPYGHSKLAAEAALADALADTGVDFASMRFANVYGPRQDWRGEGGVVAIFCARLAAGERPVIYGDGRQSRDFIFVGDIVSFILEAIESTEPLAAAMPDGPAYNVSTGVRTTVNELAMHLNAASGVLKAAEHLDAREGDVGTSALDPSKALERLGWNAQVPLESGLSFTWRWISTSLA